MKKTGFSIQGFDLAHYKRTEDYVAAIDRIYSQAILDVARLGIRLTIDGEKPFNFDQHPGAKNVLKNILLKLSTRIKAVIETGSREQWLYANAKNDAFLESIMDTSKIRKSILDKIQDRNLDALKSFQTRKVNGMNLSERIWWQAEQFKEAMELGLDVGIGDGKSAQQLSRELRGFLKQPDKLFRRVRDKRGQLQLSKAAKAYNPGQGIYRSSYKNAMRLTRSEINMSYRTADGNRWKAMDFINGFEVKLSNNHTLNGKPFVDVCDELKGKYPKSFEFVGWHPQCRCFRTPILQAPDEFNTDELNELKAALNGTEYKRLVSRNAVNEVPPHFNNWIEKNRERIAGYKSTPYFIRDNFIDGKITEGLKI
ncbi:MAG TPA: hypothetical protein DHV48_12865 [Prolixibacteraceae bacterium]|nr:hypothetical protein [Prolixibacteraceae bacterium]